MNTKRFRMGVAGLGARGTSLIKDVLLRMGDVDVVAVCDNYLPHLERGMDVVEKASGTRPMGTLDYHELMQSEELDAVLVSTSWETHIEIAIEAMRRGIPVALEVCGGYSIQRLWDLVHTQEDTGTPLMFMENCCFGESELLATAMARNGLFGEIVHCHGCYGHYLPEEIASGNINHHYRLRNYLGRNCENYPTHELGPIAKLLNINRGNQMLSLVSIASKSVGMRDYINRHTDRYPELVGKDFRQGDMVNTLITCADGSTISLRLDTTLPRSYAREFTVRGTRGLFEQDTFSVYLDGEPEYWDTAQYYRDKLGNAERFKAAYLPRIWSALTPEDIALGHGGMDALEFRAFVDAVKNNAPMPIDVYDAAAWMSITALSEASIAAGGMPQAIPDFTGGLWTVRQPLDVTEIPMK